MLWIVRRGGTTIAAVTCAALIGAVCSVAGCSSLGDESGSGAANTVATAKAEDRIAEPPPNAELYSIAPDGSDLRQLTKTAGVETSVSVSPDGMSVAFYRQPDPASVNPNALSRLVVASADGKRERGLGPVHVLRNDYVMPPAWSPDSRSLAWTEGHQCDTLSPTSCWKYRVWTVDAQTGKRRLVARRAADPVWSPDGRHLAYVRVEWIEDPTNPIGIDDTISRETLIVAEPDGSMRRVVARGAQAPAWSSDGRLAFVVQGNRITISNADGSAKRRIGRGYAPLSWSPDRRTLWANLHYLLPTRGYLVIPPEGVSERHGYRQGFRVTPTDEGRQRFVRSRGTFGGSIANPWSRDGQRTVWPGGSRIAIGRPSGTLTREIDLSKLGITVHSAAWGGPPRSPRIFFTGSRHGYLPCYRDCP